MREAEKKMAPDEKSEASSTLRKINYDTKVLLCQIEKLSDAFIILPMAVLLNSSVILKAILVLELKIED